MVRRAAIPALLAILVLLLPLPSLAQGQKSPSSLPNVDPYTRKYSIRGNVRFEQDERPVENIKIELTRFSGGVMSVTFTRSNGEFEFAGLDKGEFFLIVQERGYEPVRQSCVIYNSTLYGVQVYLKKLGNLQPEDSDPVSVRELSLSRDAQSNYRKAMDVLYKKHEPESSVELLQKVVIAVPDFYEGHFQLGVAYDMLHKPVEAEAAFRKSIATSSEKYPHALIALASLLTTQDRPAEAEPLVRQALALDAKIWQGHYEMGRALTALNRIEDAEKSLQESVRLHSDYPPAYLVLANVHIRTKNQTALLGDLNEFLRLDPSGPQSEQARKMRDYILHSAEASKGVPAAPPKP